MTSPRILQPDFPINPARCFIYYGWIILVIGTVGALMSIPGHPMGFSAFIDPLIKSLGVSRVQLSSAYFIGTIPVAFVLPWMGYLLDKYGARLIGIICSIAIGTHLIFLSASEWITTMLVLAFDLSTSSAMAFCVIITGFVGLRIFSHGVMQTISRVMISKWFNKKRGLVMGISGSTTAAFFAGSPMFFNYCIGLIGWQSTWFITGFFICLGFTSIAWFFYRDNPEECGLRMDNAPVEPNPSKTALDSKFITHHEFSLKEAVKTLAFWVHALTFTMTSFMFSGISFNLVSIGAEMGLGRNQSLGLFIPIAVFNVSSGFFLSWLSDRVKLKYLQIAFAAMQILAMTGLLLTPSSLGLIMFIFCQGTVGGFFIALFSVMWPRYFGLRHLGTISSLAYSLSIVIAALGTIVFSLSNKYTSSYGAAALFCMSFSLILLLLSFKIDNPQEKFASS